MSRRKFIVIMSFLFFFIISSNAVQAETGSYSYFKIGSEPATAYVYKGDSLTKMALLQPGEVFINYETHNDYYVTYLGNEKVYVEKMAGEQTEEAFIPTNVNGTIIVKLHKEASLYNEQNKKIATVFNGLSINAVKELVDRYEFYMGGKKVYLLKKEIAPSFTANDAYFTTLSNRPFYISSNGKLIQKGELLAGKTFHRIKDEKNFHIISYGENVAYVAKEGTIPSKAFTLSKSNNLKVYLKTKSSVSLFEKPNLQAGKLATLNKEEQYSILGYENGWYAVVFAGKKAYIHPNYAETLLSDLVNSKATYYYDQLGKDIERLKLMYNGIITTQVIGQSVDGRNLYAIKLGTGKKEILINGSHHAREYMTTNVLMEMIDSYALSYMKGTKIGSYNTKQILSQTSIWFVPMVNPDGVTLVQKGHKSAKNPAYVLKLNGGSSNFESWKANIRGVDLNNQYPANWNTFKGAKSPAKQSFKGYKPLSEPEVISLVRFVRQHSFKTAVAYHSSGNIIYWHYNQKGSQYNRDYQLAKQYSNLTGYSLVAPKKTLGGTGTGFTDWFIDQTKLPGFTPEIAPYVGKRPVPNSYFDSVWKKNATAGLMLAGEASRR